MGKIYTIGMKNYILLSLFVFCFSFNYSVWAQDALTEDDFTAGSEVIFNTGKKYEEKEKQNFVAKGAISENAEVTIIEDKYAGQYIEPTVQNISKLLWKNNVLNISNDTTIDNFLLINECDIYKKFYTDDFEWMRIREAGRDMLKEKKDSFSNKFKMIIPIDLGRYDTKRKGFPLINKTAFKDLRRIEIGGNSNGRRLCNEDSDLIEHYVKNLILILNKPFTYDFVKLDEHMAQALIIRQKYETAKRPKEIKSKRYDRLAFARVRITFTKHHGTTKGRDNYPIGVMFGRLDGIDIFEDAAEKRMLTSIDYN